MAAGSFRLDNLWALVDCNGIQADGQLVLRIEPVADKFRAFGWTVADIDGNDMHEIVQTFDALRRCAGPRALVLRTTPGRGVPTLESRERAHFVRVNDGEWAGFAQELERHA